MTEVIAFWECGVFRECKTCPHTRGLFFCRKMCLCEVVFMEVSGLLKCEASAVKETERRRRDVEITRELRRKSTQGGGWCEHNLSCI